MLSRFHPILEVTVRWTKNKQNFYISIVRQHTDAQ